MPVNISGVDFDMRRIANLPLKKFKLVQEIEEKLVDLKKEFLREEVIERKGLLSWEKLVKLGLDKGHRGRIKLQKNIGSMENPVIQSLVRDIGELRKEEELLMKIYSLAKMLYAQIEIEATYLAKTSKKAEEMLRGKIPLRY